MVAHRCDHRRSKETLDVRRVAHDGTAMKPMLRRPYPRPLLRVIRAATTQRATSRATAARIAAVCLHCRMMGARDTRHAMDIAPTTPYRAHGDRARTRHS